jgi:hypothetical protein
LLGTQAERVEHLVEEGFLTPEAAEAYLETIRRDIQRLENVKYERNRSLTLTSPTASFLCLISTLCLLFAQRGSDVPN